MPRPPLPIGTYGEIWVSDAGQPYKARARFRDTDGVTRTVARFGQTKTAAKNALRAALAERASTGRIDRTTTVRQLAQHWLADVEGSDRSVNTKTRYRFVANSYVIERMGSLLACELTTGVVDTHLKAVAATSPSVAKSMRAVLNGMMRMAVANGLLVVNPVRETTRIKDTKTKPRSLTEDQADNLVAHLLANRRALPPSDDNPFGLDLVDLVDSMLMTGSRIGEMLAARDGLNQDGKPLIDWDAGTWEVNSTIIRVDGARRHGQLRKQGKLTLAEQDELARYEKLPPGLYIQEHPKSDAGHRVISLPESARRMWRDRLDALAFRPASVRILATDGTIREEPGRALIFPSPSAMTLRDPSNALGYLRDLIDRIDCPECRGAKSHTKRKDGTRACSGIGPFAFWVKSHTLRKTVATKLDEAGFTPRQAADQLGQSDPALTQRVYFGRKLVNPEAARVLDRPRDAR